MTRQVNIKEELIMDKESRKIVGNPALLLVDPQKGIHKAPGGYAEGEVDASIFALERVLKAAREAGMPVIFFQEIHRKEMVDYGRSWTEPRISTAWKARSI